MNGAWWVEQANLDEDQRAVISLPLDGSYLVLGPPGSGKTNLLLLRANYLSRAGRPDVRIVVFTRTLRDFIASGATRYAFRDDNVVTYNSWVLNLLREHGVTPVERENFEEQREGRLNQLIDLVDREQIRGLHDVVLVDEAHDFTRRELEIFARLGRNIFAVADLRQQIHLQTNEPVEFLRSIVNETIELRHHYRTGRAICRLADGIMRHRDGYQSLEGTSNYDENAFPSRVMVFPCSDLDEQCYRIIGELETQLATYPDEMIGVVCPRREELVAVSQQLRDSDIAASCTFQDQNSYISFDAQRPICVCTVHSSKGLEFRALHFAACERLDRFALNRNMAFTGFTRAKTSLSIYHSGNLKPYIESALAALNPPSRLPSIDEAFGRQS